MAFLTLPTILETPTIVRSIAKTGTGVASFTISAILGKAGRVRSKGNNIIVTDGNPGISGTLVSTGGVTATTNSNPALETATQAFTGDGSTTIFALSEVPDNRQVPTATVDGTATAITIAGIQITFATPPPNADDVVITYVQEGAGYSFGVGSGTNITVGNEMTMVAAPSGAITSHLTNNLALELPIEVDGLIIGTSITGIFT